MTTQNPTQINLARLQALLDSFGITAPPRTTAAPSIVADTTTGSMKSLKELLDDLQAKIANFYTKASTEAGLETSLSSLTTPGLTTTLAVTE